MFSEELSEVAKSRFGEKKMEPWATTLADARAHREYLGKGPMKQCELHAAS
jgi:hypothetical protein